MSLVGNDLSATGNLWIRSKPANWRLVRFKNVLQETDERSLDGLEELLSVSAYSGVSPRSQMVEDGEHLTRAESLVGYKVCNPDDLVMNIMLTWNRALGFAHQRGIVSPAYAVFRVLAGHSPRFLDYLVRSDEYIGIFKAFSAGVIDSRLRLYPEVFGSLPIALPCPAEQSLLADFLDEEIGKIDGMISDQEHLLELLDERRQVILSSTLLEQKSILQSEDKLEHFDLPRGWSMARVKDVTTFQTSGSRGWSDRIADTGALFIQSGNLTDTLRVAYEGASRVAVPEGAEANRTRIKEGDVLVCITGAKTGNVAVCLEVPEAAYVNQHVCLLRPNPTIYPEYLGMFLKSKTGQDQFIRAQYGLKQGLSLENVRNISLALPPLAEQRRLAAKAKNELSGLDSLAADIASSVRLFEQRRSRIISEVVTGRVAPSMPAIELALAEVE